MTFFGGKINNLRRNFSISLEKLTLNPREVSGIYTEKVVAPKRRRGGFEPMRA